MNSTTGKEPLAAQEGGRTGRRGGPGASAMAPTRLRTGPEVMPKDPQVRARVAPKGSGRTWNHVTVGAMPAAKDEPGGLVPKFLFAFKPPTAPLLHTRCSQPQSSFMHLCALVFLQDDRACVSSAPSPADGSPMAARREEGEGRGTGERTVRAMLMEP